MISLHWREIEVCYQKLKNQYERTTMHMVQSRSNSLFCGPGYLNNFGLKLAHQLNHLGNLIGENKGQFMNVIFQKISLRSKSFKPWSDSKSNMVHMLVIVGLFLGVRDKAQVG